MPEGFVDLPLGWKWATVGDMSREVRYGYTFRATREPVGPRFLRITDIKEGEVDWSTVPYCRIDERDEDKYRIDDGDLLFARSGSVGKSFLARNPPRAVFASYLIRVRAVPEVLPAYLYWFFQTSYYWKQIPLQGITQPNVNAKVLRAISLPFVPLNLQSRIVSRIAAFHSRFRTARSSCVRGLRHLHD